MLENYKSESSFSEKLYFNLTDYKSLIFIKSDDFLVTFFLIFYDWIFDYIFQEKK